VSGRARRLSESLSRTAPLCLILAFSAFLLLANASWILDNREYWGHDESVHLAAGVKYAHLILQPSTLHEFHRHFYAHYPPLLYLTSIPLTRVFGLTYLGLALAGSVYYMLFVLFLYLLATRLTGSRLLGAAACLLTAANPSLLSLSHEYNLEAPLLAAVAAFYLAVYASDIFASRRLSWVAGIALGLGMLIKTVFAFYAAAPFVLVLGEAAAARIRSLGGGAPDAARNIKATTARLGNALRAGLLGAALAGIFYVPYGDKLLKEFFIDFHHWSGRPLVQDLTYYLAGYWQNNHVLVVLLSIAALVLLLPRALRDRRIGLLYLWILVPHAAFTAFDLKFFSYTYGYFAAAGILAVLVLARLDRPGIVAGIASMLILFSLAQFGVVAFRYTTVPHFDPDSGSSGWRLKYDFFHTTFPGFVEASGGLGDAALAARVLSHHYARVPVDRFALHSGDKEMDPNFVLFHLILDNPDIPYHEFTASNDRFVGILNVTEKLETADLLVHYALDREADPWPVLEEGPASTWYGPAQLDAIRQGLQQGRDRFRLDLRMRMPEGRAIFCLVKRSENPPDS